MQGLTFTATWTYNIESVTAIIAADKCTIPNIEQWQCHWSVKRRPMSQFVSQYAWQCLTPTAITAADVNYCVDELTEIWTISHQCDKKAGVSNDFKSYCGGYFFICFV